MYIHLDLDLHEYHLDRSFIFFCLGLEPDKSWDESIGRPNHQKCKRWITL